MSSARGPEQLPEVAQPARRWLFADAVLDERSLTLSVNGDAIELERKPLEVLLHLLHHAGEVVTKDELLASVWPGRILSDSSMTSCLYKLREALGDDDQAIVKTVHGYGYRLVAPVTVEEVQSAPRPRFEFKLGEHLPMRPLWSLIERLGTGGHGEAWLARHDKTHERRVYKFAADTSALVSLKREITIYRLLHDSLGDRPDFVALLDWNLEEPPCFVEYDYLECGSLSTWARAQGGIDRIPLTTRVEIAAQVAEALGAAHSVGVLHKDLKPSNVLIECRDGGAPQAKLCDFGSGGVLDVDRLDQMGITRLGFTRTAAQGSAGATPLYLAPEVISGQPFTVRSDIYALGVMLYQLVVGNLHKPLAPGWEQDVHDEELREDIAQAAEGHAEQRIADASRLAQRLRALDERRRARAAQRAATQKAERERVEIERVRARRTWVRLAFGALTAGLVASSLLYLDARRARIAAAESAATSQQVSDFLSKGMFGAINVERRPVRDLTLKEVLDAASAQLGPRFSSNPVIGAELNAALGSAYYSLGLTSDAGARFDEALRLLDRTQGPGSERALEVMASLPSLKYALGQLDAAMGDYQAALDQGRRRLGPSHPRVIALRRSLAHGHYWLGHWRTAANELEAVLPELLAARERDDELIGRTQSSLGLYRGLLGEFAAAEVSLRAALDTLLRKLGNDHLLIAAVRRNLGELLAEVGRYGEADAELTASLAIARKWVKDDDGDVLSIRLTQGRLRLEQGRPGETVAILSDAMSRLVAWAEPVVDQTLWFREGLAEAHQKERRLQDAVREMQLALDIATQTLAPGHPATARIRIGLADILREQGRLTQARDLLQAVNVDALRALSPTHPLLGRLGRVDGLLLEGGGEVDRSRQALQLALEIFVASYGAQHRRVQEVRADLARVSPARS